MHFVFITNPFPVNSIVKFYRKNIRLIFYIWTIMIIVLMVIPGNYVPPPKGFLKNMSPDKIVHLSLIGSWTFMLLTLYPRKKIIGILIFAIFGTMFGALLELIQLILPIGRAANIFDVVADVIGASIAAIFGVFNLKKDS